MSLYNIVSQKVEHEKSTLPIILTK